MVYKIRRTDIFKEEYRKITKKGYNKALFWAVVDTLADNAALAPKHRDHALADSYTGFRECRITSDWMLIYKIENDTLVLVFQRMGAQKSLL